MMTIQEALAHGRSQLHQSPTPQVDARLLLQHLLDMSHSALIAHGTRPLTPPQQIQYTNWVARAAAQEPIPYIIGQAPFFDFDVIVTPDVLIPRPETEQLVELAINWANDKRPLTIVDVGTGSGCIPIALARKLPKASITAVDISTAALAVAQSNAERLAPQRIAFTQGHLLQPIIAPVSLITANLPYVTDDEWTHLDDGVKLHEPELALKGGADGLDLVRELLQQATTKLTAPGAIFLEIGWQQGTAVCAYATRMFPQATTSLYPDFSGHDRIVTITQ
jgi:release factor glutamine methyltransferase